MKLFISDSLFYCAANVYCFATKFFCSLVMLINKFICFYFLQDGGVKFL